MLVFWKSVTPPLWVEPDTTVWIDVIALDASWHLDMTEWVGPGGTGQEESPGKFRDFHNWVTSEDNSLSVQMPWVCLKQHDGQVSFTNGRHRFAWMRDYGVKALPIDVPPEQADEIGRRFGTLLRRSIATLADKRCR